MTCKQVQKKLILQLALDREQAEHLATCRFCRACAADIQRLALSVPMNTPLRIKLPTVKLCLQKLGHVTSPHPRAFHLLRLWQSPRLAVLLSAVACFLLAITVLLQLYCESSEILCRIIALFLFIVFLQNFLAALCAPIILQKKAVLTLNI